jgi:hypothetical protein
LQEVTVREVVLRRGAATVRVLPGAAVALQPDGTGRHRWLEERIEANAIGYAFTPATLERPHAETFLPCPLLKDDVCIVRGRQWLMAGDVRVMRVDGAIVKIGADKSATVTMQCLSATVPAPWDLAPDDTPTGMGFGHAHSIHPGATLYWPDGRKAGRVRASARYAGLAKPLSHKAGRVCGQMQHTTEICAAEADVDP